MALSTQSQFYVPGPTQWFVNYRNPWAGSGSNTFYGWQFLGYCEDQTQVSMMAAFEEVKCDYAGPMMPADLQQFGEAAYVAGTLSRYSETTLRYILARRGLNPTDGGYSSSQVIGGLMLQDNLTCVLCLVSAYGPDTRNVQAKASNNDLPGGHTFYHCHLHENMDFPLSSRVKRPRLIFRATAQVSPDNGQYLFHSPIVCANPPLNPSNF